MFLLTILKGLKPFYKGKRETEIRNFFFNGYIVIYGNIDGIRNLLKQDLALAFCRRKNKGISTLTETYINYDQIHHQIHMKKILIGGPSSSLLEIVSQKDCLFCFIRVLKVAIRLTLTQKRDLCPLRLLRSL